MAADNNMLYKYQAKKLTGEETEGVMEAVDKNELAVKLRANGYIPFLVKEKRKAASGNSLLTKIGIVSSADKIMFSRNLGVMMSAGLSIAKSLEIIVRQMANQAFRRVILILLEETQKGNSLSESMGKHPKIFSKLLVAMVKTGEESGRLSDALQSAGQQLEKDHMLMKRIKGAMMYPSIIVAAMMLIGVFMFVYIVPNLVATFKSLNVSLPLSTKVIIAFSNIITHHFYLVGIFFILVASSLFWFLRTEKGRLFLSGILLRTPLISPIVVKVNSARTSRVLASLISSGVNLTETLAITRDVVQNSQYKKVLTQAINDVQKGLPLSNAFKQSTHLYPVLLGEMMSVGEETGKVSDMLDKLAEFYEEEVAEATKNMTTVIEPILMVFIGAAVGFFAISMIKPMYSMLNGI